MTDSVTAETTSTTMSTFCHQFKSRLKQLHTRVTVAPTPRQQDARHLHSPQHGAVVVDFFSFGDCSGMALDRGDAIVTAWDTLLLLLPPLSCSLVDRRWLRRAPPTFFLLRSVAAAIAPVSPPLLPRWRGRCSPLSSSMRVVDGGFGLAYKFEINGVSLPDADIVATNTGFTRSRSYCRPSMRRRLPNSKWI